MIEPGTRVRMNDRCAWPERRGAEGVVVAPKVPGQYPDRRGLGTVEVLVLLDDDPIPVCECTERGCARHHDAGWWTCAIDVRSVDVLT